MKEYLKKIKFTSLAYALVYLAIGMTMIATPSLAKDICIILFGSVILLGGIMDIVSYFLYGYEPFGFVYGMLKLAFGIIILCCFKAIADSGVFGVFFGIVFIFDSLFKIQNALDYHRLGAKDWWISAVFGVLIFVLGIIAICNPFNAENVLIIYLGITICLDALFQIVSILTISCKAKKVKRSFKEMFCVITDGENAQTEQKPEAEVVVEPKEQETTEAQTTKKTTKKKTENK